jgi:expansin (peptidoglycan-binding protein)
VQSGAILQRVAVALLGCGLATASLAAVPETGCPGSWVGSGEATYYDAFSQQNACALPLSPEQYVVAVAAAVFDGSVVCGRCLRITGPLGSIVARITDYCVGSGCRDLDLSPNAFAAIGNPIDGIIPVSWESGSCDVEGPIAFYFDPGSNPYYAKIQVRNHRYGIAGLAIAESGHPFVELDRSSDNAFEFLSGVAPFAAPLSLRVIDLHGAVLESNEIAFTPGSAVDGEGQFPLCPEPESALGGAIGLSALALLEARRKQRKRRNERPQRNTAPTARIGKSFPRARNWSSAALLS